MIYKLKTLEISNKKIYFTIFFKAAFFAALFFLASCGQNQITYYSINGQTMGTTYHITFEGSQPNKLKAEVDN
ncbi:MAG: hypothetical protein ACPGLV_09140, partial [Bacteroidia bacterium]